ncbi:hypothetical protein TEA_011410 [Camellia sinensis var. sinensis]|uniref:RWP-RK domain-containing protein n=1 Tax=Camellia sinensis var. sinensis TaxID=542762 RepID=A0A4S4EKP9_CAMSN|nr:hypothetical protein TEA_011410 [Camellia sinensis var. sinensis]
MGVVETALKSLNLVFCADVTQFSITEYPMTHYAQEFGLSGCGCFSVCLQSSNPGNDIYVEFFLPTVQTLKLSPGEELGEEFSEVIDFHNGEKFNFVQISQTRPEPLQNGADLMELESSDQQSMDAVNNESNVISAERSNSTCSQGKGTRKKLKRKQNKTGALEMSHNDAANSLHVSKSTLKHVCRDYSIKKWPPSKITKFSVGSLPTGSLPRFEPLQNEGDMMQHQQSMDAINITNVVGAEQSNIAASEMSIHNVANSLHGQLTLISISTLKRACRKLGIPRWPPHHINTINKNGGSSVQISPTTGSLPRSEPLKMKEKGTMKMPYREDKKTGVRIAMPSEHILQTSKESLEGAAEHHGASQSAFKSAGSPYVIQRWPTRMHSKNNEKLDSIQVFQITRSLPRPGPLQNGDDQMMQLDSSNQQSMDAINITNVVGAEQSNIAVTCSQGKKKQ